MGETSRFIYRSWATGGADSNDRSSRSGLQSSTENRQCRSRLCLPNIQKALFLSFLNDDQTMKSVDCIAGTIVRLFTKLPARRWNDWYVGDFFYLWFSINTDFKKLQKKSHGMKKECAKVFPVNIKRRRISKKPASNIGVFYSARSASSIRPSMNFLILTFPP